MGKVERKLSVNMTLDSEKEKELIELIDKASRQHKLGEIITHLLRIYNEEPDELNKNKEELTKLILRMSDYGLTPKRQEFFTEVTREMEQMKCKVDDIYDMCMKVYTLAQFGKRLGLEGKAKNMLMAEFILEKQVNDLCNALGVDNLNHIFNSNKFELAQQRSDDILEYILESYDNIVEELKKNIFKEIELKVKPLELEVNPLELDIRGITVDNISTTDNKNQYKESIVKEEKKIVKNTGELIEDTDDDEIIDFGDADISALEDFFGG